MADRHLATRGDRLASPPGTAVSPASQPAVQPVSSRSESRCTTCTPTGVRRRTSPRTPAATRPSRPRSTCGTTGANAPTTTSLRPVTTLKLAVIAGDGIGPEVTSEALKVLEVAVPADVKLEPTSYDLGAE